MVLEVANSMAPELQFFAATEFDVSSNPVDFKSDLQVLKHMIALGGLHGR